MSPDPKEDKKKALNQKQKKTLNPKKKKKIKKRGFINLKAPPTKLANRSIHSLFSSSFFFIIFIFCSLFYFFIF